MRSSSIDKYIPKRLSPHLLSWSVDSDGYWVWGDSWILDPSSGSSTIHAESISELRRMLSEVIVRPPVFLCSEG